VAPLRYAVRLVDGEQGNTTLAQQIEEIVCERAFGRHVEQIDIARNNLLPGLELLLLRLRRIEECGVDAILGECVDLVLHQCDQRRNDDADTVTQERGYLVTKRFATPGRHQYEGIAALDQVVDDLLLLKAKLRVAEAAT